MISGLPLLYTTRLYFRKSGAAVMAAAEQRLIETSLRTGDVDGALHAAKKASLGVRTQPPREGESRGSFG